MTQQEILAVVGAAGGVGVLSFLVGDATLARAWTAFARRIQWEEPPNVDEARTVRARLSHEYPDARRVTYAFVVVPQPLGIRVLWRLFHPFGGLPRWIIAASFLEEDAGAELPPGTLLKLQAQLDDVVPLPTLKLWDYLAEVDPLERRLVLIVRFTRRRFTLARRVAV